MVSSLVRRTVFDHLPKTGGTAIASALAERLGETAGISVGGVTQHTFSHDAALKRAGERRLVTGHLWFVKGKSLRADWHYATVLREPIDKLLSLYSYYRENGDQALRAGMVDPAVTAALEKPFAAFVQDPAPEVRRLIANPQAAHFASRLAADPEELDEVNLLGAATKSLADYDLVGSFDQLQNFFDVYCRDMDMTLTELPRVNVTGVRIGEDTLDPGLRAWLAKQNAVDRALRDWASKRLEWRIRGARIEPGRSRAVASEGGLDFGDRRIEILSARISGVCDARGRLKAGGPTRLALTLRSHIAEPDLTIGFAVVNSSGATVVGQNTRQLGQTVSINRPKTLDYAFDFTGPEIPGDYTVTLAAHRGLSHLDGCYHWKDEIVRFVVG